MTVELDPHDFPNVLPLYRSRELCFPLISAVIQRSQRGQIFAPRKTNPESALVINNFGFMCLIGAEPDAEFDESLTDLFESGDRIKPSYLLWYSPPLTWQQKLNALGPEHARLRERIRFEFRGDRARYLNEPITCPPGFELRKLDAELVPKTKKFGIDIDSRFWASAQDLEQNGLSFCILKDDEVVSLCYAAAISDGLAEVDVLTDESFRGRGLARVVSRQFIRECLTRAINPTWDCFAYNTSSLGLARKLGFSEVRRYPFYSFNVPLSLDHGD